MKVNLTLQPGNKMELPMDIPSEEVATLTVLHLKEKIMALNKTKKIEELHLIHGSTILDDEKLFTDYNVVEGGTIKFLFAPVMKGESRTGTKK